MFRLFKPTDAELHRFIEEQRKLPFTYTAVGATLETSGVAIPLGYNVDRTRVRLGTGDTAFVAAKDAIRAWKHFDMGWVGIWPAGIPIENGSIAVVLTHSLGLWSAHTARIVYTLDEPRRFGFAYGTLPGHAEQGEERFLVEQLDDGSVWYDVIAFSRPRHILAKLSYPMVRRLQKRFGRDTAAAMLRVVQTPKSSIDR
jgi:uncharacterized protein (UPF0548 family)